MHQATPQIELTLIKAVVAGDPGAAQRFLDRYSGTLWSAVVALEGDGAEGEQSFLAVIDALKADGYARLKPFDGQGRLATYLAIVTRDVLADRLAHGFVEHPDRSWIRFERFFGADLRRRVAKRFPRDTGTGGREDAYQEICLKFIEDNYRRIRAYDGLGSFTGYILTVAERILIDLVRRDAPRQRLPAAVSRLSGLDQEIYAAIVWRHYPVDADRLAATLRGRFESDPGPPEIVQAIERLSKLVPLIPAAPTGHNRTMSLDTSDDGDAGISVPDSASTPEQSLLDAEDEQNHADLLEAIKAAAAELPPDERLYLQTVFGATDPMPAREIARAMQLPVEDIYRLKQRAQRWLAEIATRFDTT